MQLAGMITTRFSGQYMRRSMCLYVHECEMVSPFLHCCQAHFINNRTMEVFRQMRAGVGGSASLAEQVAAASPPLAEWRRFVYCESLTGTIFGEVDHFKARLINFHRFSDSCHIYCVTFSGPCARSESHATI